MHHLVQGLVDLIKPLAPYTINVAVDVMPDNAQQAQKLLETTPVKPHKLTKSDDIRLAKNVEKLFKESGVDSNNSEIVWFLNKEQLSHPNSTPGELAWLEVPRKFKTLDNV